MRTPDGGHTTNYTDTLITVAEDTAAAGAMPPPAGKGTVAERQFALLEGNDYALTSDDVLFTVWADRCEIAPDAREAARKEFFAKGQPCLRTSPLPKTYGWGVHSDAQGRVALVPMGSQRYADLVADDSVTKVSAMRSTRR